MLKYENKKRMIRKKFRIILFFIFLRISGIINVFLQQSLVHQLIYVNLLPLVQDILFQL